MTDPRALKYWEAEQQAYAKARQRIAELEAALQPFAKLADEIEECAGPNGNPDNWAKACTWPDLVTARSALRKSPNET